VDADGAVLSPVWSHDWKPRDVLALLREDGQGGFFGPQPFTDAVISKPTADGLLVVDRRV
jgi:hypothetical protein